MRIFEGWRNKIKTISLFFVSILVIQGIFSGFNVASAQITAKDREDCRNKKGLILDDGKCHTDKDLLSKKCAERGGIYTSNDCYEQGNFGNRIDLSIKSIKIKDKKICETYGGAWVETVAGSGEGKCIYQEQYGGGKVITDTAQLGRELKKIVNPNDKKTQECPEGYKKNEALSTETEIKCELAGGKADDSDKPEEPNGKTSCDINKVGWVVCPTSNFLAESVSGLYKFIANNFLTIKSGELFGVNESTFTSWGIFRDMANVILVIMFAIVIISQITSVGISNYGIKKMLPRLVIFAILINVSYFVTVIFVDASNIIGRSIFNILSTSGYESGMKNIDGLPDTVRTLLAGGTVVSAVVASGGIILSFTAAMLAVILMFVIMIARQAIVILLVVISPVAFASAILPNTESFFNKWKSTLKAMLIVFPTASLVMGSMLMASKILVDSAGENYFLKLIYTVIPIVGLFSVYMVIKGVLAIIDKITGGSVSGKIGGMINGLQDKAKNSSLAQHERNMWGNASRKVGEVRGIRNIRGAMRKSRLAAMVNKDALDNARAEEDRDGKIKYLKSQGNLSNPQRRELQRLEASKAKEEADLIGGAAKSMASGFGFDTSGRFTGNADTDAISTLSGAFASGDTRTIDQAIKAVSIAGMGDGQKADVFTKAFSGYGSVDMKSTQGQAIAQAVSKNMDTFGKLKNTNLPLGEFAGKLAGGKNADLSSMLNSADSYSNMTAKQLSEQGGSSMQSIGDIMAHNESFRSHIQSLAKSAMDDKELFAESKNKVAIESMAKGLLPPDTDKVANLGISNLEYSKLETEKYNMQKVLKNAGMSDRDAQNEAIKLQNQQFLKVKREQITREYEANVSKLKRMNYKESSPQMAELKKRYNNELNKYK